MLTDGERSAIRYLQARFKARIEEKWADTLPASVVNDGSSRTFGHRSVDHNADGTTKYDFFISAEVEANQVTILLANKTPASDEATTSVVIERDVNTDVADVLRAIDTCCETMEW